MRQGAIQNFVQVLVEAGHGSRSLLACRCCPGSVGSRRANPHEVHEDFADEVFGPCVKSLNCNMEASMSLDWPTGVAGAKVAEGETATADGCPPREERQASPLPIHAVRATRRSGTGGAEMGIDKESELEANLQVGPTTLGMVRIFVEGDGLEVPMDFEPDEADEIADEIKAAAGRARALAMRRS